MFTWFKLSRKRWYWAIRHYTNLALFYINRFFFNAKEQKEHVEEDVNIAKSLSRSIIGSVFLSILIILLFSCIDKLLIFIRDYWFSKNSSILALISKINPEKTSFVALFSVVASVAGVFLGLYFTAISVVISTYAKFPDNIRSLLLKERVGNFYIRILSISTVLSVYLIGCKVFFGEPGKSLSLFVLLLGCYGIFCFSLLGIRAFFFFDPASFGDVLFHDIRKYIKLSTIKGFRYLDNNFQAHYQKTTAQKLRTLKVLVEICVKEKHLQETSLLPVLIKVIYTLQFYETEKAQIPSNSRWFNLVPVYKNTFLTDPSAILLALQTHSWMQPEMVPNTYWFEDKIWELLSYALEKMIEEDSLELACDYLNALDKYFEQMGYDLEMKRCVAMLKKFNDILQKYFLSIPVDKEDYDDSQLSLLEVWSVCFMSAPLGFYRFAREVAPQTIIKNINNVDWLSKINIYDNKFPPVLLPRLEYIKERLRIEKAIEGDTVSPNWYLQQLIIIRYIEVAKESVDELIGSLNSYFIKASDEFIQKKAFLFATMLSKRGLESCSKMQANLPHLETTINSFSKDKLVINDIPCPKVNWEAIRKNITDSRDKLIEIQAKCLPTLSLLKKQKNRPDFFGLTYNTVCNETYYALVEKRVDKFKELFPLVFFGAIMAFENLRNDLKDRDVEVLISIASEPLIDILSLSGYAKVYSELYGIKDIWDLCVKIWDGYLKNDQDRNKLIKKFVGLQEYRKSKFRIFPRDYLRTNWETTLRHKLIEMNIIDDMFGSSRGSWDNHVIKHDSAFIRALYRGRYERHISAADIFIIVYLLKQPEASGIEFKDYSELGKDILEEETKTKEIDNGETKK